MINRGEKLIWFQHLHKCAGTSVVEMARVNGEVFPPLHANGNPTDTSGNLIETWNFSKQELNRYVDALIEEGVTFVASELGGVDFQLLSDREDVCLLTIFRDPYKRYLSAFYFSYLRHGRGSSELLNFWRSWPYAWSYENYYTRIFSRIGAQDVKVTECYFEIAMGNIKLFDVVMTVEQFGWQSLLAEYLNWNVEAPEIRVNKNSTLYLACRSLMKGDFSQFIRRLRVPIVKDERYRKNFNELNKWDVNLYESIKK